MIFADCDTSNLDANPENVFFTLHSLHIVGLNPVGYAFVKHSNLEVSLIVVTPHGKLVSLLTIPQVLPMYVSLRNVYISSEMFVVGGKGKIMLLT